MPLIIIGFILGVGTLASVNATQTFGFTCYHFGRFNINSFCLNSGLYFGALGIAAALVVLGVALLLKKRDATPGV